MSADISTDKSRLDIELIHDFLAHKSYWARGITRSEVESCVRHSSCFGIYVGSRQVGFARLVTDFVRFAHLMDVFVIEEYRGRGLGKQLMRHILTERELAGVARITLGTHDAHGLYEQFGFAAPANPERSMELLRPGKPVAKQV